MSTQVGRNSLGSGASPAPRQTKPLVSAAESHPLRASDSVFQNDDNFLNIIYEAYLFSLTQAAVKKTL